MKNIITTPELSNALVSFCSQAIDSLCYNVKDLTKPITKEQKTIIKLIDNSFQSLGETDQIKVARLVLKVYRKIFNIKSVEEVFIKMLNNTQDLSQGDKIPFSAEMFSTNPSLFAYFVESKHFTIPPKDIVWTDRGEKKNLNDIVMDKVQDRSFKRKVNGDNVYDFKKELEKACLPYTTKTMQEVGVSDHAKKHYPSRCNGIKSYMLRSSSLLVVYCDLYEFLELDKNMLIEKNQRHKVEKLVCYTLIAIKKTPLCPTPEEEKALLKPLLPLQNSLLPEYKKKFNTRLVKRLLTSMIADLRDYTRQVNRHDGIEVKREKVKKSVEQIDSFLKSVEMFTIKLDKNNPQETHNLIISCIQEFFDCKLDEGHDNILDILFHKNLEKSHGIRGVLSQESLDYTMGEELASYLTLQASSKLLNDSKQKSSKVLKI